MKKIIFIILILFSLSNIVSCKENSCTNLQTNPPYTTIPSLAPSTNIDKYNVEFKNYDGTLLKSISVTKNTDLVYTGNTPVKPSFNGKDYIFIGWDKSLNNISSNLVLTAQFEECILGTEGLKYELSSNEEYYVVSGIENEKEEVIIGNFYNGKTVKEIKRNAFKNSKNIKHVTICEGIIGIKNYAFGGCTNLLSIKIPNTIEFIEEACFSLCNNLTYNIYDNGKYLGNESNSHIILVGAINQDISSCIINHNTKIILDDAFFECHNLSEITIPDGIKMIGYMAFSYTAITSIRIPKSVVFIANYAFLECGNLNEIVVDPLNNYYNSYQNANAIIDSKSNILILGCLNSIIPQGVDGIESNAFYGCRGLNSLIIPSTVKFIGESAFGDCVNLNEIYYHGDTLSFSEIIISDGNEIINNARIYFYSKDNPQNDNYYWYYDESGNIKIW